MEIKDLSTEIETGTYVRGGSGPRTVSPEVAYLMQNSLRRVSEMEEYMVHLNSLSISVLANTLGATRG